MHSLRKSFCGRISSLVHCQTWSQIQKSRKKDNDKTFLTASSKVASRSYWSLSSCSLYCTLYGYARPPAAFRFARKLNKKDLISRSHLEKTFKLVFFFSSRIFSTKCDAGDHRHYWLQMSNVLVKLRNIFLPLMKETWFVHASYTFSKRICTWWMTWLLCCCCAVFPLSCRHEIFVVV